MQENLSVRVRCTGAPQRLSSKHQYYIASTIAPAARAD